MHVFVAVLVVLQGSLWSTAQDRSSASSLGSKGSVPPSKGKGAEILEYRGTIQPLLAEYCYACHAGDESEGGFRLDNFASDEAMLGDIERWSKVLKNVRAGVMPPVGESKPTQKQIQELAKWIKSASFGIDPTNIDPGRVTMHRLNRVEYRNTILQLLGVRYDTDDEFPPDAAGLGLDNIADLLTMSPLMLEKYLDAAEDVLEGAFPSEGSETIQVPVKAIRGNNDSSGERISFNRPPEVTYTYRNTTPGQFRIAMELEVVGLTDEQKEQIARATAAPHASTQAQDAAATDSTKSSAANTPTVPPQKPITTAHFVVTVQSGIAPEEVLIDQVFTAEPNKFSFVFDQLWSVEPHKFDFNVVIPVSEEEQPRGRRGFGFGRHRDSPPKPLPAPHLKILSLAITPQRTKESRRYFALDVPPDDPGQLNEYIQRGIAEFGRRAFRRPLDPATLALLVDEVESAYAKSSRFNDSLKPALAKLLCSPRFLFRADRLKQGHEHERWALIDEYSLASRLSYFLWSGMPDDELLELAGKGELRQNLQPQVTRMLADEKAHNLVDNFSGQWLQTRNVMNWPIVESAVLEREGIRTRTPLLTDSVRRAMQRETTMFFAHVLKENRSVLDFLDSDYTFLNAELADYYSIPGVSGTDMKLVKLPHDSPRGGVLTMGSTLMVTSNANRTSPVKRGVFVLDNILGMRPHDPPPGVPSVEQAGAAITDHVPTFREMLELHRKDALCASCHSLMDPIGLGLDSFNAMGMYREKEFDLPIVPSGRLASGEEFSTIRELKNILKTQHRQDFYRCLTNKLMAYALGRGLEYYDTESVDQIVERLEREDGRFSAILLGIIDSAPFQKRRGSGSNTNPAARN